MSKYTVKINTAESEELQTTDLHDADLSRLTINEYHLIQEGQSYHAEVLEVDTAAKSVTMLVNDQLVTCAISDELDALLDSMDLTSAVAVSDKNLVSSMPGLVLDVMVSEGQEVQEGDPLMILEAMKMENVLKATAAGTISSIQCQKGDAVEKHQLLIEID